jgi:hypothetical protein
MSTIVLRSVKGSPLTNAEVDSNFTNLNNDKTELGGTYSSGTANGVLFLSSSKVLTTGSALTFDGTNFKTTGYAKAGGFTVAAGTLTAFDAASGGLYGYYSSGGVLASYSDNSGTLSPLNFDGSYLAWRPAGSEQMRLTSTGLGIGTSSPGFKLDVAGTVNVVNGSNGRINIGATNNYLYGDSSGNFIVGTSGSDKLQLTSSGNLGLGVTPSAWDTAVIKAVQIGTGATFAGDTPGSAFRARILANAYYGSGAYRYIGSGPALLHTLNANSSTYEWNIAGSGTAGNAITFTQAMTLDTSGNLVIGNTSAADKLNVWGGALRVNASTGDSSYYVRLQSNYNYSNSFNLIVAGGSSPATLMSWADVGVLNINAGTSSQAITFSRGATESARIDSSGNLLVGTTSSAKGTQGSIISEGQAFENIRLNGTGTQTFVTFNLSGTTVGSITASGSTTTYNTSSDYRLKNTVAPMTGALAKVAQLKPCTYKWNADGSDGEGFIAHELAEVVPQCVTGEKDAVDAEGNPQYQGIDTSFLVATLTAAIQELKAEFDAYKASHP